MSSATATNIALQPIPAVPAVPAPPASALFPVTGSQELSVEEALNMFAVQVGDQHRVSYIARTDTGRDAWMFLIASVVVNALIWGTHASFPGRDDS